MGRILFVQTGNFGEACRKSRAGEAETYHDQYRSVDFVRALAPGHEVTVASIAPEPYDIMVDPGVRAIGVAKARLHAERFGAEIVAECEPDMLVARLPHYGLLTAAVARNVPTFPCLADIFDPVPLAKLTTRAGWRVLRFNRRMKRLFNEPAVPAIGNHSLSASLSVHEVLGIPRERITPWEWSKIEVPERPKVFPEDRPMEVLYVGKLSESKGVGDLLDAVQQLDHEIPGRIRLTVAGTSPDIDDYRARAGAISARTPVTFLGKIPKEQVRGLMQASDVVVVPSRPSYAEGLPNAVVEGLGYRAALVVAEHSSTRKRLSHEVNALVSRPLDPTDMARQIRRLAEDRALFKRLSTHAAEAYRALFVGASWYELIEAFVADPVNHSGWVERHSLQAAMPASGRGGD